MADLPGDPPALVPEAWPARCLMRAARAATLATARAGTPYAALVTPVCLPDGAFILLLSQLSEHTRQLAAEPRCALLLAGPAPEPNPQTAPRLTISALAAPDPDPALRRRYLAIHPYAALYADFADFAIWRLTVVGAHFVGGFARAARLDAAALAPDPAAGAAILAAESAIMTHCNTDHPDAMARIAVAAGGAAADWRMVGVDTDGCDLADGTCSVRVAWQAPVRDAGDIRAELVRLAKS